jgi:YD repeat-containing protein
VEVIMPRIRLLVVAFTIVMSLLTPIARTPVHTRAASTQASGAIPWHPHYSVALASGLAGSVDLADGHLDLTAATLGLPARGLPISLATTWDSTLALAGTASIVGQGWQSTLSPRMSGAPGSTVTYTDGSGARWSFTYSSGSYQPIAGLPYSLVASGSGYTLTNILTGAVRQFNASGQLTSEADSYGYANILAYGSAGPTTDTNSGGRVLHLTYNGSNLLSDVQSPLWVSSSGAQGQHVTLSYGGTGCGSTQLCALTRGAGTSDTATAGFAYSGSLLHTVTTPGGHAWTLGYDSSNRLISITSPISGTTTQPGYTPSYTTEIAYGSGTTTVTEGYGTPNALATTYTLDGGGEPTAIADVLGHTTSMTYDGYHDVLTTQDPDTNLITNTYTIVSGAVGLPASVTKPAITPYGSTTPQWPFTSESYSAAHDLTARQRQRGGDGLQL